MTDTPPNGAGAMIGDPDVIRLESLLLTGDDTAAREFVNDLRDDGVALETIYLELLAPTARYLGEGWDDDRLDFADVTLGLARLHRLLHELRSNVVMPAFRDGESIRRILLAPTPKEQHTLGVLILSDFFRSAGWRVDEELGPTREQLCTMVEQTRFDVLGLSVSCDRWLDDAADTVQALRRASCHHDLRVILGGPAFAQDPDLALRLGADAVALDGRQAVEKMNDLVSVAVVTH
ncbi:MAG: B12-binding domain-containing protein [Alphaproteobacteria bacterium]